MRTNSMKKIAINYITLGHHHIARLRAIGGVFAEHGFETYGVQVFAKDSDYEWVPVDVKEEDCNHKVETVFQDTSTNIRQTKKVLWSGIKRFLDRISPDVLVITGWGLPETIPALYWCRKRRIPAILLSDSHEIDAKRVFWKEWIKRLIVRQFDAAFVAGSPQGRYVAKLGMRPDVIWHGSCVVDNDYWSSRAWAIKEHAREARRKYDLPDRFLLCVSRFVQQKDLPTLLRAYASYRRRTRDPIELVLCGSGSEEVILHTIAKDDHIKGVSFRGFQQVDNLVYYYALATCFILPSISETWGLVVNEAMASGLPVIVSRICGCAEDLVKDGKNGYVFDPGNADQLAGHMLAISEDTFLAAEMGHASQKIIDCFSCKIAAYNLLDCVTTAIKRKHQGR